MGKYWLANFQIIKCDLGANLGSKLWTANNSTLWTDIKRLR